MATQHTPETVSRHSLTEQRAYRDKRFAEIVRERYGKNCGRKSPRIIARHGADVVIVHPKKVREISDQIEKEWAKRENAA